MIKEGQPVTICGDKYIVSKCGRFIIRFKLPVTRPFKKIGVKGHSKRMAFVKDKLGYDTYGLFPMCKDLRHLNNLVFTINTIYNSGQKYKSDMKVKDKVTIGGQSGTVIRGGYGYFVGNLGLSFFRKHSMDNQAVSREVLGYYLGGIFPECKTLSDLKTLVDALNKRIDSKSTTLKEGDKVTVCRLKGTVLVRVNGRCYISFDATNNSRPFTLIGKDKEALSKSTLGYYNAGGWPECKNLQDLTLLVNTVNKLYKEQKGETEVKYKEGDKLKMLKSNKGQTKYSKGEIVTCGGEMWDECRARGSYSIITMKHPYGVEIIPPFSCEKVGKDKSLHFEKPKSPDPVGWSAMLKTTPNTNPKAWHDGMTLPFKVGDVVSGLKAHSWIMSREISSIKWASLSGHIEIRLRDGSIDGLVVNMELIHKVSRDTKPWFDGMTLPFSVGDVISGITTRGSSFFNYKIRNIAWGIEKDTLDVDITNLPITTVRINSLSRSAPETEAINPEPKRRTFSEYVKEIEADRSRRGAGEMFGKVPLVEEQAHPAKKSITVKPNLKRFNVERL